ncbi:MAG TPA: (2Fe-2S)-binding protein [Casimicrobiaceae bacterium]|nr:(2Fe-2S)-binding protein [Casimicrobiaceae bacterium]
MSDDRKQTSATAISRRDFLKGAGAAVAGMTASEAGVATITAAVAAEPKPPSTVGDAVRLEVNVNGTARSVVVEPSTTLAEFLREDLGLIGTKIACDRGACSACTVWLDGKAIASCMLLAIDAAGRDVTTIEGLAPPDALHPVQESFIAHDALQCGFCTPGLVMSCAALLEHNAHPSRDEVEKAISGHLCRCGSLPHVVDATLAAAQAGKKAGQ